MLSFVWQWCVHQLLTRSPLNWIAWFLVSSGFTQAALPPIIDISQAPSQSIEIERLHSQIESLQQQLEKAQEKIAEQAHLIECLQNIHQSPKKAVFSPFRNIKAQPMTRMSPPSSEGLAEKMWGNAFKLLKTQQYTQAIYAFQQFIKKYPNHPHQSSAYYFLGQLALLQGNPTQSLHYFKTFVDQYADDIRVPDAKFHMGLAYYAQQNNAMAYKLFIQLEKNYPNHPIAKQAHDHRQRLNLHENG